MPPAPNGSICLAEFEAKALNDGLLVQIRRPVKPQPPRGYDRVAPEPPGYGFQWQNGGPVGTNPVGMNLGLWTKRCPLGAVGSVLWVRESWAVPHAVAGSDDPIDPIRDAAKVVYKANDARSYSWRSPVTMPRWASRTMLRIAVVRPERLQAMKWADYFAAGSPVGDRSCGACESEACLVHGGAKFWYRTQWTKVNGRSFPWETNPWVWVLEIERVHADERGHSFTPSQVNAHAVVRG